MLRAFYEELIDVTEVFIENENEILDEKSLKLLNFFAIKQLDIKKIPIYSVTA